MALSKARQDKYKEAREKLGAGKAGESRDTDSSRTSRPSEETSGKALSAERRAKYEEARNRAYMVDAANNALRTGRPRQTEPAKSSGSTDGHADTRQERSSFAGDGESRARKGRLAWMDEAGSIPGTQSPGLFDVGTGAIMDREQMNKARLNSLDRRRAAVAAETEEDEDAILRLAREDPAAAREQIAGRVAKSVERDELFNEIYPNSGVLSTLEGMGEGVNIGMTKQFPASMAGLATGVHEGLGTFWNMINTPGGQKYADYESPLREKALDMQEKAALASEENLAGRGPAGTRFVSTAQAAGNMIPGAVLGGVGGVLSGGALAELGTAAISAGAAGSSYLDAISQGAGVGEAAAYGLLSGATEYYTERLFGGNPLVDKRPGLVNQVVKKLGGSQKLLAFLASQPVETMNEGLEEAISEVLSPVWQRLTYDPDADFATLDQIMDSAIDGVLLAGFMQGGEAVIRRTANAVRGRGAQGDDNPSAASRQLPLHRGANGVRGGVETATPQIAAISAEMAGEAAIPQSAELTAPFTQGSQGKARETWGDNPSVSAYAEPAPLAQGSLRGRGEPMGRGDYDGDALRAREVQLKADALQAAKQTMGERGYATFEQAMRDDQDPAAYYRDMVRAYNEGISGLASTGSETLTEVQYSEMYAAGRVDAAASLRREQKAAGYASVAGADSGLVYDEFVQEAVKSGRALQDEQGHAILDANGESRVYLTAETADKINSIAKELGVRVQFVDSIRGGEANAAIIDSTVLIQRNNENPVAFLIGHEMTHRIQQLAPKEYRAFREIVAAERFDQIQAHIDSYARQNEILTYEEALDEAAADYAGQLVDSGEAMDAFIRRHREDRTLLQRVRDAIRALIDKLRGAERRKAQTAAGKLEAAMQAATEQARRLEANKNTARTDGAERTAGGMRYSIETSFRDQVDAVLDHTLPRNTSVYVMETPEMLQALGLKEYPMLMTQKHVLNIVHEKSGKNSHWHGLSIDTLKQLPEMIESPVMMMESASKNEDIVIVTSELDGDGLPIIVSIHPDGSGQYNRTEIASNFVTSMYGRSGFEGFVDRAIREGRMLYNNKKRTQSLFAKAKLQLPGSLLKDGFFSDNVSQSDSNVKTKSSLQAATEQARRLEANKNTAQTDGAARYSIKYNENNRPFVEVEQDILAGVPEADWVSTVKENLKKKFPNGVTVGNSEIQIDKQSRQEMTFSRYMQWLYKNDPQLRKDKLRATNNADEILYAATDWVNEGLNHPRKDKIADFSRGNVLLRVGENDYMADVVVGTRKNGSMLLYDVINLQPTSFTKKETDTAIAENPSPGADRSTVSISDGIVRRNDAEVNGKFSLKAGTESKSAAALQEENRLLREQMKDYIAIQRQNAKLRESRNYWQGQTRKTQRATADKKAVAEAAKRLIRSYGTDIDAADIQSKLQSLSDYVVSGYDGKDELTYTEVFRRAESIARELVENAVDEDTGMYDTYSDLRDYLRTTKIIFGKEYHGDIADYGDFRKRQFGRLKLSSEGGTNIDQVYLELCERWPELFDEQEQSNPADQLLHIAEVLDAVSQTDEYNPFSHYMEQAVAGAANEVIETVLDLPQTRKTFADRQALKLDAAKAADRQRLQKAREQNAARLAELRKQNRQRVQNIVAKAQETRARQIDALKERHKARDAAARESRNAREVRAKIIRHAKKLSQKLLRPSDKQHIPEQLRTAVSAMLESINLESQYTIDENGKRVKNGGGSPTKRTEAFIALKEQYAKIRAEGGDLVIDPSLFGSEADIIQGGFDAVIAMQNVKLADMSPAQLETVWQVVKAVEHSVRTAGRLLSQGKYETTAQMADSFKSDVMTRRRKLGGNRSISLETPYTFFAHFGKTGMEIYRMLRNAQDRQELMARDVAERVQSVLGEKASAKGAKEFVSAIRGSKVWKMNAEKQSYTTSAGAKLELTTAQAMEIYLLSKREQGRQHLLKGGIYQPEIRDTVMGRVTTQRGTQSIVLNEADLDRIGASLSAEAKRIADGLQELTAGTLAEYGNEASMRAYGYRKFREKFYWPIKSARESLHSNQSKSAENVRDIKNIGMAQQLNPDAATPLEIGSVFDTFANHASDMIDYAAWLNTIEDVNRLFNFKYRDQLGNKTGQNFKDLLDEKGGKGSQDYLMKLLGDIQNGTGTRDFEPFTAKAARYVGKFKGAAVGANIRVIIQQPTAFFRASVVLSPADMLKGMTGGVTEGSGWEKALAHSATAMRKEVGSFDISSPYTMSERFYGKEGAANKLNELAGTGAGKADEVTWGKLWNACEWQVNRERPGLRPGSEAFYSAVDEVFTDMIDQTQVVDGVLQRSNIMRGKSALAQQATAFMGEPIMSLNVFIRAYDKLRYETEPQKRSAAIKNLGRAAAALVVTNVVNAVAQSLIDAMRDDDGDKKYWERFWEAFTGLSGEEESAWEKVWTGILNGNVGSNMNPLGQIPFVKDGLSLFQGYSVGRTDMEVFSDVIDAAKLFVKSADGGSKTTAYAVKCLLASAAKLEGLPVSNLTRDVWALIRTVAVETDNIPLQYEMEKAIYNISNTGNKNRYYTILYRALEQGDMDSFRHIREELINSMGIDGASIDSAMRSRYATTREKDPDYALSQRARDLIGSRDKLAPDKEKAESFGADDLDSGAYDAYSEQRADDYRSMADALALDPDFNSMDDETRDKVLDNAYELADKGALAAQSGGRYEVSNGWIRSAVEAEREYGIKPEVYVMLKAQADAAESLRDENGSAIANSKSLLIMQAVYNTSGLTERQRSALFEYLGVGKTVLHYNRARVNEKLAEMGALAG